MPSDRAVFTVKRHNGQWVVEYEGEHFGHSPDKEVARAEAAKRIRLVQEGGRACQIRVTGETGFWAGE
jgi:hypothetical protein